MSCVQAKTGSRIIVTPGARIRNTVHSTVPASSIIPIAARKTPTIHRS